MWVGMGMGMGEQEECREVACLEVEVQWLSREVKAACLHLQLLQIRTVNELRASSNLDPRADKRAEELQMLK